MNFDLLKQLTFYGSYHNNKWNQLIHAYFVPTIFWTVAVWMAYTPNLAPSWHLSEKLAWLPWNLSDGVVINGAALQCLVYWLYYMTLEVFAGLSWGVCVAIPLWISATLFRTHVVHAWAWALGIHVFSWYMQIHPGHMLLEGRKPALLDSFFQSLVLAPLFVWFEFLFLVGYRPALYAQLQTAVNANIAAWQASTVRKPLLDEQK